MNAAGVPPFNPASAEVRADPQAVYRRLLIEDPTHWNESAGMWFLARHADCSATLRNPDFSAAQGQQTRAHGETPPPTMLTADPPEHSRLRRPMGRALHDDLLHSVADGVGAFINVLLDRIAANGTSDLVPDVAVPVALFTMADLLGLPAESRGAFKAAVLASVPILDPFASPVDYAAGAAASDELSVLLRSLVEARTAGDGHDLISRLAREPGDLDVEELVAAVTLVVVGGYGPLESLVSSGLRHLLEHVELLTAVAADGSLIASAVNELVRLDSPIPFVARVATADVTVGDATVACGDAVIALLAAANLDPAGFDAPETVDLRRVGSPHIAFGAGPHTCIGAALVRLVMHQVIEALVVRLPHIPKVTGQPIWHESVVPRRLSSVPITH